MRTALALLAAALAALSAAGFPPIPKPKERKFDLKALEGRWTVVKYEYVAATRLTQSTIYQRVAITPTTWTQFQRGTGKAILGPVYSLKVDGTKSPPWVDMTLQNAGKATGERRGVLELKGDQLTVAYSLNNQRARPEKADTKLAAGQYRWVLKREKP